MKLHITVSNVDRSDRGFYAEDTIHATTTVEISDLIFASDFVTGLLQAAEQLQKTHGPAKVDAVGPAGY